MTRTSTELVVAGRPPEVVAVTGVGPAVPPAMAVDLQLHASQTGRVH